ncbi:hypothetical protein KC678_01440 [Candidatus Dojkabacteria bacterium]|uniref:Uncharacterized protein n=1 Tax=Candidatus Dojkabacteria bacterium TaxID=2099670 RepID=A0A955I9Q9_9BACT|nr:hypothetical protein [Candidatus Dojkabacteria bacterium]
MIEEHNYTWKETASYSVTIQEADNYVFVHLNVSKWTVSVMKELKNLFIVLCEEYANKGHELIFSSVSDKKTIKMCELIHPLYEVKPVKQYEDKYWVVAWETGLEI